MILVQTEDDVMDFLFSCVFTSMKSLYFSMPLVVRTINIWYLYIWVDINSYKTYKSYEKD